MRRNELDLAIARMGFLRPAERLILSRELDRPADLSVLSISDLELLCGRRLGARSWDPDSLLRAGAADAERAAALDISFAPYWSADYPPLLRELPDPPTVLFYRGTLGNPERPLAAVVGTRNPSAAGAAQAYEFGRDFARSGVSVISGLALGIDAMAHRGCVDAGFPTYAVLGSGLDSVYPKSNRALARRIVEGGGALIGEYPPGEPPLKFHFPARNRIIAGLARALVVVEAPVRSGALISADFALDQGRDLWVSSAGCASARGEGTRKLAADGAPVAVSAFDVVGDWGVPAPLDANFGSLPRSVLPFRTAAAGALESELNFGSDPAAPGRRLGGVR